MLMIRFQRVGRRNDPAFRLVAVDRRAGPKSGGVEVLGSYHPKTKEMTLKDERIRYWIGQGAQTSDTVRKTLIRKQVISGARKK